MRIHPTFIAASCVAAQLFCAGLTRAQDPKLAPTDLKNFKALADKGHLIAQVELQTGEQTYLRYRYDRYPGVVRIVEEDGSVYARAKDKGWLKSNDWGKTGDAAGKEKSAELDNFAGIVELAFAEPHPSDMSQGATVWRFIGKDEEAGFLDFTYERSREKPRKDGAYPRFSFIKREGDKDGHLILSSATGQLTMGEKLTPFEIDFDYAPDAVPKPQPEELLPPAKKIASGKPLKVDVFATGDANCRVSGIISGKDFDLTVQKPDGSYRQIAVGDESWRSDDDGKTWTKEGETDRRYYFLAHAPVNYSANEMIPPFEIVPPEKNDDPAKAGLQHLRFKSPQSLLYVGDRANYWLAAKAGGPPEIVRFYGPLVFGKNYSTTDVQYSDVTDGQGVIAPPGNPEAAAHPGPEVALMQALQYMAGKLWKVDAQVEFTKKARITGLLQGRDYDLNEVSSDGKSNVHQITIGDLSWGSFDGGKTWKKESADDRDLYNVLQAGLFADRMKPAFEIVDTAKRGDNTLLHIREIGPEKPKSERDTWQYWLLMDKDNKPLSVQRFAGYVLMQDNPLYCDVTFTPAPEGAAIKPPK
ncbi:MAG TPA: hypothetical protein VG733_10710 [Chthoniobacteraceae bacterium]|nr:hypothetical protein [Chthoniobacteraceae bacterium]